MYFAFSVEEYKMGLKQMWNGLSENDKSIITNLYVLRNRSDILDEILPVDSYNRQGFMQFCKRFCQKMTQATGKSLPPHRSGKPAWCRIINSEAGKKRNGKELFTMPAGLSEAVEELHLISSAIPPSFTEDDCEKFLSNIAFVTDDRNFLDNSHNLFIAGWMDASFHREVYDEVTLKRLTWHNLGYMLGNKYGVQRLLEMERLYDAFSKHYQFSYKSPDEVIASLTFAEGASRQITVNAYERNPQARRLCIEHYGTQCAACRTDLIKIYGKAAEGLVHVHHLRQLSEIGQEYTVDPIQDLRPVCPNCHAVIHRRRPPYSIEEIQAMLRGR